MTDRVLIADDEADIRMFLRVTLEMAGFDVLEARNGDEAVALAIAERPALLLLDVMMPGTDGVEACRRVRADARVSDLPVIMVTALTMGDDKVRALDVGADDYVTKPFDPDVLVARIQAMLRRVREMRSVSPLTGLPGNARIQQELIRRVEAEEHFALLYADLNEFKGYNDHYGWVRGDEVIQALADVLMQAVISRGDTQTFVGHVGGDDFAVIQSGHEFEDLADLVCASFDERAPSLYDEDDRERGHIEVVDRRGERRRIPIVSVSIGVAHTRRGLFPHPSEAVSRATEMKSVAKRERGIGSNWAADRRPNPPPAT